MIHRRTIRVMFSALLALPTIVHAMSGTATLTGTGRLGVSGCGSRRTPLSAIVTIANDATWTSQSGYGTLAGTYASVGKTVRKVLLTLDSSASTLLVGEIVSAVQVACHLPPITVKSTPVRRAILTISKKLTTAKLAVRWVVRGKAGGHAGTATLTLRGHGNWAPA